MGDFNPGFSFDAAGDLAAPTQAPWEFAGALKMALKDPQGKQNSSIDDKISRQLQAQRQQRGGAKQQLQEQQQQQRRRQRKRPAGAAAADDAGEAGPSDAGTSSDADGSLSGGGSSSSEGEADEDTMTNEDDSGSSDSAGDSDQPLPGELDGDDDSDDGITSDASSDDGDDDGGSAPQQQRQQSKVAAAAAARKAAGAATSGAAARGKRSRDSSSSEGGDAAGSSGSEQQPPAAAGSGKKQRRQQQQGQQQQPADTVPAANGTAAVGRKTPGFFAETQRGFAQDERTFQDLQLSRPLLRAVAALGFTQPTPIQAACIPLALAGRDICGSAMTGSGKTAAFALPILERLLFRPRQVAATYVLILAPTRELAAQIHSMVQRLSQFTDVDAALIVGGLSLQAQAAALRAGPAIVVGTPGRVIDHVRNSQGFGLEDLAVLVLDEADRLLEMGFKEELRELLRLAPRKRQTMLFSATFNDDVQQLAALSLKSPVRLAADPTAAAPAGLSQEVIRLKGSSAATKEAVLLALASRSFKEGRTMIFCKTKQRAHRLKILFGLCELPPAAELHGDMTQAARLQSLERFRKGEVAFLLATDVAARGLDILGVQVVLNFDAPSSLETYLHRIGRTARAGATGLAVTLVGDEDRALLKAVVKQGRVQLKQRVVPQQAIGGWEARIEAAEPALDQVLAEEREEAALRKAEMEVSKAQNLMDHEAAIFSRPARTWFQTGQEKKAAAAAAAPGAAAAAAGAASKAAKAAAKAVAKQDKRNAKLKEQRAAEAAAGGKKVAAALQSETEQFSKAIRGVKSRARALMQQGMPAKAAQAMARKAVTGVSTKHQKKKRKTAGGSGGSGDAADGGSAGGLFSGDGTGKPTAAAGDGASAAGRSGSGGRGGKAKGGLNKVELNRLKRGGKGKSSFKSKKKFKRRK